jgi:hypothetical protein
MGEAIDGKTTTVQQIDTMKGMIARKGERIIIKGGTTTLEMIIQEIEGVMNKERFLGITPKSMTEEKEVLKEKETELPHASSVVNQATMQKTAQRNSKIQTTLREKPPLLEKRNKERH